MKRCLLLKLGFLVLAGAIINVGVAWGCEMFCAIAPVAGDAAHGFGRTLRLNVSRNVDENGRVLSMSAWPTAWEAGWPSRSFSRRFHYGRFEAIPISFGMRYDLGIDDPYAALPLRPLWPGFAINTIFYAAVLWMLFAVPGAVRRKFRIKQSSRGKRMRRSAQSAATTQRFAGTVNTPSSCA